MKHFRKNDGFTLVELMVSILVGTLITGAAVTVLLLGLRIHKSSTDTASRQNTTRIVLTVLENLAEEGKIKSISKSLDSWKVLGSDEKQLMSYSSKDQKIYTGNIGAETAILENVYASHVELNGQLLTFAVETEDGSYATSIYCRTIDLGENGSFSESEGEKTEDLKPGGSNSSVTDTSSARALFLEKLLSQKDRTVGGVKTYNPGMILDGDGQYKYYTEWYIGGYNNLSKPGWNKDTPWCGAYIAWCLNKVSDKVESPENRKRRVDNKDEYYWYANVDDFAAYIKDNNDEQKWINRADANVNIDTNIQPGDLVFFDWIINAEENPQHMGVVLSVSADKKTIFTIEGNTAGRVALRKYAVSDERILGYGVLNWISADQNAN